MPQFSANKLKKSIKTDIAFVKSHTLQPQWYKKFKIFILVGVLVVFYFLFGLKQTLMFLLLFLFLSFLVHMLYRTKTETFQKIWMDFKVNPVEGNSEPQRIGMLYYTLVFINAIISYFLSRLV